MYQLKDLLGVTEMFVERIWKVSVGEVKLGASLVMGFDRFTKTCSWNFFNPYNRLLA